jgi:hypothetical protein
MQPDIKNIMADARAYAGASDANQPVGRLLCDLVDVIARQQAQIDTLQVQTNNLRATRPRTIHEEPPAYLNTLAT